jgi:CHRD domain-containing protein
MKRLSLLFALGVFVSGCGSSSSTAPTTPTNPTFTATLSPANEVPAIGGAEAGGSGTATVTLVTTKDAAGNVTAATATYVVNLSGFPAGTPINAAHIHGPNAPAGVNAGVLVNSGITPGQNVLTNGSGSFTTANLTVSPDVANQILATPGNFYFNVHSSANPGGVARGQLVRQQ